MSLRRNSLFHSAVFACFLSYPALAVPDYSKEAFVIEKYAGKVVFSVDGACTRELTVAVRMQSDAGVRQWGLLSFVWLRESEILEVLYVRVRKPDGTVVATPESSMQEMSSEAARNAPMYTDLREKQVPVTALGTGDVLEYHVRYVRGRPEIQNQFWYSQYFLKNAVVIDETLEISFPAASYVNVSSPAVKPEIHDQQGRRTYFWKTAQPEPSKAENTKKPVRRTPPPPDVQLTTFQSWQEVGRWYARLQQERVVDTPLIRAKAAELVKGLATDLEKEQAIYRYVSTKYRYISISFGSGRYQPHMAEEVLTNQYGDCKDKHTLFAALLKAVGLEAWPALIGSSGTLDVNVPSPAQFDHVITVLPQGKDLLWADSTPEVAPFGMLGPGLRGKLALVMPPGSPPRLMKTPADPPFPSSEKIEVKASLGSDGTLTAHFDITARGDSELVLRIVFHQTPQSQWQTLAQNVSLLSGFAGTISNLTVGNPEDTDGPFRYSYDYVRKDYSDWGNLRITPPFPPFGFAYGTEAERPEETVEAGAKLDVIQRAELRLPDGYSAEMPPGAQAHSGFADYSAAYSMAGGVLSAERRMTTKKSEVSPDEWQGYLDFEKAVVADENRFIQITAAASGSGIGGNPEALELLRSAFRSLQNGDQNSARVALEQVEKLDPELPGLWAAYGFFYFLQNRTDKGMDAYRHEIRNHPDSSVSYLAMATAQMQMGREEEAIETLHTLLKVKPGDAAGAGQIGQLLIHGKRYSEAIESLESALRKAPDDPSLQFEVGEAYLRGGRRSEGIAMLRKTAEHSDGFLALNNAAYVLADANADLALAREYGEKAVSVLEAAAARVDVNALTSDDVTRTHSFEVTWDTLGWVYFRAGDFEKAKRYVDAAWLLGDGAPAGDHLGQIYQREGKTQEAIHMYRLALAAAGRGMEETRARLRELTAHILQSRPSSGQTRSVGPSPGDELSQMRTVEIAGIAKQTASAQFFLVLSPGKVEEAQFISGSESLRQARGALLKARYNMPFPDNGPEKIVRRGILSCSDLIGKCHFVFLLPYMSTR